MDAAALARLREHFRRPSHPMGEAWFMGEERRMYRELMGDLDRIPAREILIPLNEIPAGYSAFGPMEEWHDWYHHLLAALLPRCHERSVMQSIIESLVTGFVAIYPNGVHSAPYKTFREDVLQTLGRCLMEPGLWRGDEVRVGEFLHRDDANPARVWTWWDASGDFSASMFFCLKYLPAEQVLGWLRSVLAITDPHWRAQFIVWSVGAHDTLTGQTRWPGEWEQGARPAISWGWSHCLREELATRDESGAPVMNSLLPDAAREDALRLMWQHFREEVFLEWLESISRIAYLHTELAEIPSLFEKHYVR